VEFRKSYAKVSDLLDRVYGINPLMRHASAIADNVIHHDVDPHRAAGERPSRRRTSGCSRRWR
jgi:hypothetical protein